jgi:P-type E1-E2 ATPase
VKNLQQQGKTVLMVGDGINDAPVLVQADVSIAVEGGADVAQAGSDLVMVQSNMDLVALALQQGQKNKSASFKKICFGRHRLQCGGCAHCNDGFCQSLDCGFGDG